MRSPTFWALDSLGQSSHWKTSIRSYETGGDRAVPSHGSSSRITRLTRAADNKLVICDSVSLHLWRRQLRTITSTHNLPVPLFQLQEFSELENRNMSAVARGFHKECGCTSGSLFMRVTVVTLIVSYFASDGRLSGINFSHVVSFLTIATLGTVFGKLLGLLWARWRLLRQARNICDKVARTASEQL